VLAWMINKLLFVMMLVLFIKEINIRRFIMRDRFFQPLSPSDQELVLRNSHLPRKLLLQGYFHPSKLINPMQQNQERDSNFKPFSAPTKRK
jgi:hypothetical protein